MHGTPQDYPGARKDGCFPLQAFSIAGSDRFRQAVVCHLGQQLRIRRFSLQPQISTNCLLWWEYCTHSVHADSFSNNMPVVWKDFTGPLESDIKDSPAEKIVDRTTRASALMPSCTVPHIFEQFKTLARTIVKRKEKCSIFGENFALPQVQRNNISRNGSCNVYTRNS